MSRGSPWFTFKMACLQPLAPTPPNGASFARECFSEVLHICEKYALMTCMIVSLTVPRRVLSVTKQCIASSDSGENVNNFCA